jgi:hypothetical protein
VAKKDKNLKMAASSQEKKFLTKENQEIKNLLPNLYPQRNMRNSSNPALINSSKSNAQRGLKNGHP